MAEKDWHSLLDHAQDLFRASFIPLRLACLLHHILAMCHTPASSKTLLVKVLAVDQMKSLEATYQQIWEFGMELPSPPPPCK